jgi:hypothetical protein
MNESQTIKVYLRDLLKNPHFITGIVFSFLVSLVPIIWFKGSYYLAFNDGGLYYFNNILWLKRSVYTWNYLLETGMSNIGRLIMIPNYAISSLLEFFGLKSSNIQIMMFCWLQFVSAASAYFFIYLITRKSDLEANVKSSFDLTSLAGALFYIFNNYIAFLWTRFTNIWFVFPIVPLLLAMIFLGFKTSKYTKYALIFNIAILLFVAANQINYILPVYGLCFFYFLFLIFTSPNNRRDAGARFIFGLKIIAFFIIFNLWWILPSIFWLLQNLKTQYSGIQFDNLFWLQMTSKQLNFFNLLWLNGLSNYVPIISKTLVILIPAIFIFGLFYKSKENKNYYFFFLTFIAGIFLMKGLLSPGEKIFLWMFNNIPGFQMFRYAYEKLGVITMVSGSVMFGLAIGKIFSLLGRWKYIRIVVPCLILVLLPISVWNIFTPGFLPNQQKIRVEIPKYYYDIREYLKKGNEGIFSIVSFPMNQTYYGTYNWEHGYKSVDSIEHIIEKPVIKSRLGLIFENAISYYLSVLLENQLAEQRALSMMNVKYIFINNDREKTYDVDTPQLAKKSFESNSGFDYIGSFGEVDLFKIKDRYFGQLIYIPRNNYFISGDFEALINLLFSKNLFEKDVGNAFYISDSSESNFDVLKPLIDKEIYSRFVYSDEDAERNLLVPIKIEKEGKYRFGLKIISYTKDLKDIYVMFNDDKKRKFELDHINSEYFYSSEKKLWEGEYIFHIYSENKEIQDLNVLKNLFIYKEFEVEDKVPELSFKMINPAKFEVEIKGAKSLFPLIFSQTFDPYWKAKILLPNGKSYLVDDKYHFKVNGFANSWYIDQKGDSKIVLFYLPQIYFYYGLIASGVCILILVSIFFFRNRIKYLSKRR